MGRSLVGDVNSVSISLVDGFNLIGLSENDDIPEQIEIDLTKFENNGDYRFSLLYSQYKPPQL